MCAVKTDIILNLSRHNTKMEKVLSLYLLGKGEIINKGLSLIKAWFSLIGVNKGPTTT